jgi:integrase
VARHRIDRQRAAGSASHASASATEAWHDNNLVSRHENGDPYTARPIQLAVQQDDPRAGIGRWHAHEGRHTAVSIMSSNGVPIQEISDTVGHKSTHVTEIVSRHVIVPAIRGGASDRDGRRLRRRRQHRRG